MRHPRSIRVPARAAAAVIDDLITVNRECSPCSFFVFRAYTVRKRQRKEGGIMAEADDINMDLDDWIFADEDCGPSER